MIEPFLASDDGTGTDMGMMAKPRVYCCPVCRVVTVLPPLARDLFCVHCTMETVRVTRRAVSPAGERPATRP